jgi:hypothetical protein
VLNTGASSEKRLAYERNTGVISNGFLDGKPLVQRWGIMFDYQGIITLLLVYRYSLKVINTICKTTDYLQQAFQDMTLTSSLQFAISYWQHQW